MTERVIVTLAQGTLQVDVDLPLCATPKQVAAALGWEEAACVVVQGRGEVIGEEETFSGRLREGDYVLFEEGTAWRQ